MNLSVLYQRSVNSKEGDEREIEAIQKAGFNLSFHRNSPTVKDSIVVGRYSVVPFYRELEEDLVLSGSKLIHNFAGHRYIATGDYLSDLGWDITPRTWDRIEDISPYFSGPFFLKGRTSSRKDLLWGRACFAPNRESLGKVRDYLEPLVDHEGGILIREWVPFVTYLTGVTGMPITNEWRVFCYGQKILASGYYWASYDEETINCRPKSLPPEAYLTVVEALKCLRHSLFCAIDVAEKASGGWTVVEVNDGQMSGLSLVDPFELYSNLYREIVRLHDEH